MLHQGQRGFARGDIAADDIHAGKGALDPAHAVEHTARMAVGCIDHDDVHASLDQSGDAFFIAIARAHRSADAQLAQFVLGGQRVFGGAGDVFYRDEPAQEKVIVDDHDALQAVAVHQRLCFFQGGAVVHRDQPLARGHDFLDGDIQPRFEAQVAVGDDAHHLPRCVDHRQPGNLVRAGELDHGTHPHVGRYGDRVAQHTGLVALDFEHLGRLLCRRKVLVNDADSALLRQGDGQARVGNGIHGGGYQGKFQRNAAGKPRAQVGLPGEHGRIGRYQEHVIESQRFFSETHAHPLDAKADYRQFHRPLPDDVFSSVFRVSSVRNGPYNVRPCTPQLVLEGPPGGPGATR